MRRYICCILRSCSPIKIGKKTFLDVFRLANIGIKTKFLTYCKGFRDHADLPPFEKFFQTGIKA